MHNSELYKKKINSRQFNTTNDGRELLNDPYVLGAQAYYLIPGGEAYNEMVEEYLQIKGCSAQDAFYYRS
ncbi:MULTISPECIES: hypothetical protein [unclassified Bartonella]|uniref:hypothetical protein n=1 Tax=Bartonella TaxID=773 RepID=UPI0035D07691